MSSPTTYLPAGLPIPVPENDGLDKPYWDAARRGELLVQRCRDSTIRLRGPGPGRAVRVEGCSNLVRAPPILSLD